MSKLIFVGAFLCAGLVAACGGGSGSGVSGGKAVVSLSDSEVTKLCEYLVDVGGPARTVDCGGGLTLKVGITAATCTTGLQAVKTASPSCSATVSDTESCSEDSAGLSDSQICSLSFPSSCTKVIQCNLKL